MATNLSFDSFWDKAILSDSSFNGLVYHSCCDVWTSRSSKAKRASHIYQLPWRKVISSLDKSCEDKKQALLAKMTEEGWRLPALLNEYCKCQPRSRVQSNHPFKLPQPDQPPEQLQLSLSPQGFFDPIPDYPPHQDPGTKSPYQLFLDPPISISSSQLLKPSLCLLSPTPTKQRTFSSLRFDERMSSLEDQVKTMSDSMKAVLDAVLKNSTSKEPAQVILPSEFLQQPLQPVIEVKQEVSKMSRQLSRVTLT